MAETQSGAGERALEAWGPFGVADGAVAPAEREVVHGPRGRNADIPEAQPAGPVLHCGHDTRPEHVDEGLVIADAAQGGSGVLGGEHLRCGDSGAQQREVGLQSGQRGPVERGPGGGECLGAVGAAHNHLGQHRVVVAGHLLPGLDPRVHAHAIRESHVGQQPGARPVVLAGVLGVDARLHRMPRHLGAGIGQRVEERGVTLRQADHPPHQVHPGDLLGDRMLDLQAGVHLEERRLLAVHVVDELDGARGAVPHGPGECARRGLHPLPHLRRQPGRRGLLQHLLVPALQRAVPVAEAHDPSRPVAEDLHLQVPGARDEPLEEHTGAAEVRGGEALHPLIGGSQLARVGARLHADPPATADGLEHHRVADGLRRRQRLSDVGQQPAARDERHARGLGGQACAVLVPEHRELRRRRAHECEPRALDVRGERRVLRQEPVPGMDGPGAGGQGGVQHRIRP